MGRSKSLCAMHAPFINSVREPKMKSTSLVLAAISIASTNAFYGTRLRSTHARASANFESGTLNDQIVYQLNVLRQAHGLNAVVWNDAVAIEMQAYADSCPQLSGGHPGRGGNENMGEFVPCGNDCMHQVGPSWTWYEEVKRWNFDTNTCDDETECGHFVNSMYPGVTSIACGFSTCFNSAVNLDDSLVWCKYEGGGAWDAPQIPPAKEDYHALRDSLTADFA
ncbi:Aste57867_4660 [Aphanomyces stellatus]|uniref:Aste57867_4660 protein n=1 Tax=Aphanomyces stellatus TaxID=120398 RepID=A0A485KDE7_9STRA|nr:hypothetical protein As57867_004647 [Aphanomyces stellatus]VFT81763.1 Aste57867_4660 [Aphanomyces stellatus]